MKRYFYIFCFSLFGGMIGFLLHSFIEIPILYALINSVDGSFAGISWNTWTIVHTLLSPILLCIGIAAGFLQGKHWWAELYVKRHHKW